MPPHMKLIARYANGVGACFFAVLALNALVHGAVILGLVWALVSGLIAFNLYMFEKVSTLTSEEERLHSELRAAELRRKLSALSMDTPETVVRNHGA